MNPLASFFTQTQAKRVNTDWLQVEIRNQNTFQSVNCWLAIDVPHYVLVKNEQNSQRMSQLDIKTKMEPVYSGLNKSGALLEAIKLHKDNNLLTLKAKSAQKLTQMYNKLKRCISHKGFNDFFKPIRRLGKGAFATVYLVQHKMNELRYAAKVFSREGQKLQFKGREALDNEIEMLRTLEHPNIIHYQGIYETDNLIYLVTECLQGGTLDEFMRDRTKLKGDTISTVLKDTLSALCYLQKSKVMHRDLKPENILQRSQDGKWVLADFGLSARFSENFLYDKCGTMGYMAPQIMDQNGNENSYNQNYNSACDLYSLGIIAYEMIVGSLPFKVENEGVFEKKIVWNGFNKEQFKELDSDVAELLQGLLQKDPLKRLTPIQALNSNLFKNQKVMKSWNVFCQKKIDSRYDKILQMANCN